MISWFLLLCIAVMVGLLLAVNVYMLVHWSHPDDRNEAYFPKALVVRDGLVPASLSRALRSIMYGRSGTSVYKQAHRSSPPT